MFLLTACPGASRPLSPLPFFSAPWTAEPCAARPNDFSDLRGCAVEVAGRLRGERFLDNHRARHAPLVERLFQHGSKKPPFAGMRPDVWIPHRRRLNQAADDEAGATAAGTGQRIVRQQKGDGPPRAAFDDFRETGNLFDVCLSGPEAVVVGPPESSSPGSLN